jgi:hypothetical protein
MNFEAAIVNVSLLWLLTAPHEFAHAWVATRLGDDTPTREGRVTLNPLAHVDWIGTALLPAITSLLGGGFLGWGKPVNTNPSRLRWGLNGLALVALAGPASNVIFAVILALAAVLSFRAAGCGICRQGRTTEPLPGHFQSDSRAAARWLEAAAGRKGSLRSLCRTRTVRTLAVIGASHGNEPRPLHVAVELARNRADFPNAAF